MKTAGARKYRASEKREATKEQNRAAIEAAAWKVFCTVGLDGANIRDIVTRSGVSPGTFYNYYRTKEAIFDVLSQNVLERIRTEGRAARSAAPNIEALLAHCYESYLDLLQSIDGAFDFIARNQHHIRSQLYPSSAISGLTADLAEDLRQFYPPEAMSARERVLAASMIVAAGAEAVFQAGRRPAAMKRLRQFLVRFMLQGLKGWEAGRLLP